MSPFLFLKHKLGGNVFLMGFFDDVKKQKLTLLLMDPDVVN